MKTLILDNYDSFTYNLAQYVEELGGNPIVFKNDEITVVQIKKLEPTHIIISPGPGTPEDPEDIGICAQAVKYFKGKIPILGVCLGHQLIAHLFGAKIIHAPEIRHGKTSQIILTQVGEKNRLFKLFKKIPHEFTAMRYHSLTIDEKTFPKDLQITASTKKDNLIMALEHKRYALYGIQFHPESFATPYGKQILKNFLAISSLR